MNTMSQTCNCSIDHTDSHHDHNHGNSSSFKTYIPAIISFLMLLTGILSDHFKSPEFFQNEFIRLSWYTIAYLIVGIPVILQAIKLLRKLDFFNEFSLMSIATLGAFILGEYPEGVSVMLFYSVGELFQNAAVNKAKDNIKALLDVRPNFATVFRQNQWKTIAPEEVKVGEIIQIKVGEKVPLDGLMLSESSSFDTSALTGESKPNTLRKGEIILAGMLNLDKVIEIETTKKFEDSSLAKILELVQNANSQKAKTELFIRKFAKIYTPIVFFLAVALTFLPFFFVENYEFNDWFYRALVFLVISCPCALVISIPLGYFGGIGAASQNGILLKGSDYLDQLRKMSTLFIDKTGTLTEGVFAVQTVEVYNGYSENELIHYASALERQSTHPIARAIVSYNANVNGWQPDEQQEIAGQGVKGRVNGKSVLVGNRELLEDHGVAVITEEDGSPRTYVHVAMDGEHAGTLSISDQIREDSRQAVRDLRNRGVSRVVMLSGDHPSVVTHVAKELGIDEAYGGLMPDDKYAHVDAVLGKGEVVGFAGDRR